MTVRSVLKLPIFLMVWAGPHGIHAEDLADLLHAGDVVAIVAPLAYHQAPVSSLGQGRPFQLINRRTEQETDPLDILAAHAQKRAEIRPCTNPPNLEAFNARTVELAELAAANRRTTSYQSNQRSLLSRALSLEPREKTPSYSFARGLAAVRSLLPEQIARSLDDPEGGLLASLGQQANTHPHIGAGVLCNANVILIPQLVFSLDAREHEIRWHVWKKAGPLQFLPGQQITETGPDPFSGYDIVEKYLPASLQQAWSQFKQRFDEGKTCPTSIPYCQRLLNHGHMEYRNIQLTHLQRRERLDLLGQLIDLYAQTRKEGATLKDELSSAGGEISEIACCSGALVQLFLRGQAKPIRSRRQYLDEASKDVRPKHPKAAAVLQKDMPPEELKLALDKLGLHDANLLPDESKELGAIESTTRSYQQGDLVLLTAFASNDGDDIGRDDLLAKRRLELVTDSLTKGGIPRDAILTIIAGQHRHRPGITWPTRNRAVAIKILSGKRNGGLQ